MIRDEKLSIYDNIKNEVKNNIVNNNLIENGDRIVIGVSRRARFYVSFNNFK